MLGNVIKIICYTLVFFVIHCHSQIKVGDVCDLPEFGKGICKPVASCPRAIKLTKLMQKVAKCGDQSDGIKVCCEVPKGATTPEPTISTKRTLNIFGNNLRKSEQKCKEYSESAQYKQVTSSFQRSTTDTCVFDSQPLIFGGVEAVLGEFPHMALLGYSNPPTWLCGGSLISERFVITAAHCLVTRSNKKVSVVRLGELNIAKEEDSSKPEDFGVDETYPHPSYQRARSIKNDVALIKLSRNVQFNQYKRPACLWSRINIEQRTTIATGWGLTENNFYSINDALLKVGLDIIPNNQCSEFYKENTDRRLGEVDNKVICAINSTALGDTCSGDSGGPIQIVHPENRCIFYVIGITAAGRGCGTSLPSIYTRVSEYIDWVENIVWP